MHTSLRSAFVVGLFIAAAAASKVACSSEDIIRPVDLRTVAEGDSRFYLSGIIGPSWGTLQVDDSPAVNDPLFMFMSFAKQFYHRLKQHTGVSPV